MYAIILEPLPDIFLKYAGISSYWVFRPASDWRRARQQFLTMLFPLSFVRDVFSTVMTWHIWLSFIYSYIHSTGKPRTVELTTYLLLQLGEENVYFSDKTKITGGSSHAQVALSTEQGERTDALQRNTVLGLPAHSGRGVIGLQWEQAEFGATPTVLVGLLDKKANVNLWII